MKTLKPASLVATLLLVLGGCTDPKAPVLMFGICSPPDADACTFGSTCDLLFLGDQVIDVSTAGSLWLFVEVHNQLTPNDDPGTGRVNTNDAFIQDVAVTYKGLGLAPSSHRQQHVIPAGGETIISVFAVNPETVAELVALPGTIAGMVDIVAEVRLKGVLGDGSNFETDAFEIPIRVCEGCMGLDACATAGDVLVTCPPDPITFGPAQGTLPRTSVCVTP